MWFAVYFIDCLLVDLPYECLKESVKEVREESVICSLFY